MTTLGDLRREMPEFNDADRGQVERELLKGFQQLCKDTLAWQEDDSQQTVAATTEYTLTPTTNTAVCGVIRANYTNANSDQIEIPITNRENLWVAHPRWLTASSDDNSIEYLIYDGGTKVMIDKVPTAGLLAFEVRIAIYPTTSQALPAVIDRHSEAIKDYARWRLYMLPAKVASWSDPALAQYHRQLYDREMLGLKRKAFKEFAGPRRAKMRWFC